MFRLRTIVMVIAALACGLLAITQVSFMLSSMGEMDPVCMSQCLDQVLQDVSSPPSMALLVSFAILVAVAFVFQVSVARRIQVTAWVYRDWHQLFSTEMRN